MATLALVGYDGPVIRSPVGVAYSVPVVQAVGAVNERVHPASRVAVVEQPATMNPITSRPMVMTDKRFIVISSYAALMTSELLPSFWIPHRAAMANLGATKKSALAPDLPCLLGNNS